MQFLIHMLPTLSIQLMANAQRPRTARRGTSATGADSAVITSLHSFANSGFHIWILMSPTILSSFHKHALLIFFKKFCYVFLWYLGEVPEGT